MKKHFTSPKITKRQAILIGMAILTLAILILLSVFTLTFVIKKINLILRSSHSTSGDLHFNISQAKKLFPLATSTLTTITSTTSTTLRETASSTTTSISESNKSK